MGARASRSAPANSVRRVVERVHLGLVLARLTESILLAIAGALLVLAAGSAEQLPPGTLWPLALLVAGCAGACWWLEHPLDVARTARELDRRLLHHGALATAFELERRGAPLAPLEALVCARVLERLRLDEAVRALSPALAVPLGAPTGAALLLYFVSAARGPEVAPRVEYGALARGLDQALRLGALDEDVVGLEGEGATGELTREQAMEVRALLGARQRLPFLEEEWHREPELWRARIEGLEQQLGALAARIEPDSELAARLDQARPWLDALRAGLAAEAGASAPTGTAGDAGTDGTGQGTIAGSPPAPARPRTEPSTLAAPGPGPILGTQAGTWWPAEYDGLVARWIELSRAERSPR